MERKYSLFGKTFELLQKMISSNLIAFSFHFLSKWVREKIMVFYGEERSKERLYDFSFSISFCEVNQNGKKGE